MRQSIMKQSSKGQWRFTLPDRPWTLAVTGSELPSEVALLVASGKANSKAELVRETELARVDGVVVRGWTAAQRNSCCGRCDLAGPWKACGASDRQ